jgi:phytoene dehydrogenase-like protein
MTKEVIIVGAGIAGIASAIRLVKSGHKVQVFEAATHPGGKLRQIEEKGYRFDAGPSLFTLPNLVDELFTLCNKNPQDHFQYQTLEDICHYFYEDGKQFVAYKSWDKFSLSLANIATENEIASLKKQLEKAAFRYNITAPVFLDQSLHRFKNYLNFKTLKGILNSRKLNVFESMDQENRKQIANPHLVQYMNRFATYNGSDPYRAPALLNMIPHLDTRKRGVSVPRLRRSAPAISSTLPTPTLLTIMFTQVLCCLPCLVRSRASGVTMRPDTRLTIFSTRATQCMRGV